jgi:hypothetical protein
MVVVFLPTIGSNHVGPAHQAGNACARTIGAQVGIPARRGWYPSLQGAQTGVPSARNRNNGSVPEGIVSQHKALRDSSTPAVALLDAY